MLEVTVGHNISHPTVTSCCCSVLLFLEFIRNDDLRTIPILHRWQIRLHSNGCYSNDNEKNKKRLREKIPHKAVPSLRNISPYELIKSQNLRQQKSTFPVATFFLAIKFSKNQIRKIKYFLTTARILHCHFLQF